MAAEWDRGGWHLWVNLGPGTFFHGPTLNNNRKENNKPVSAQRKTEAGAKH